LELEYKRSLDTGDPAEAKARFAETWSKSEAEFALAKAQMQGAELLSDRDVRQLASQWFREEADRMERQSTFAEWLVHGETVDVSGGLEPEIPRPMTLRGEAVEDEEDFNLPSVVLGQIAKALRAEGIPMPLEESPTLQKLRAAFSENLLKLPDLALQRQHGNWLSHQDLAPQEPLDISSRGSKKPWGSCRCSISTRKTRSSPTEKRGEGASR
jgi:hypothetical protein